MKFFCKEFNSINEAINMHLNCIFVAIPKTGTTSIRDQLASNGKNFIPNPHLTLNQLRDMIYPYLLRCNLGTNSSHPTPDFHPSDEDLRIASKKIFDEMYKFGSVRNPWARVYSLYTRREGVGCRDEMTFSMFIDRLSFSSDTCIHPLKTKCQLDWFEDREGKIIADYIYKVEEMDEAITRIKEETDGRINIRKKHLNRVNKADDYKEVYTGYNKKVVARLFEKDIDYFKYTF